MITKKQLETIQAVAAAVVDTVREAGEFGAPSGGLYAALMAHGCTLSQYQSLMRALVSAGKLVLRHDCYFIAAEAHGPAECETDAGRIF